MHKEISRYLSKAVNSILILLVAVFSFAAVLLFNASRWVIDTWGLLTVDEIIFHLKVPLEGTNEDMIWEFVERCIPAAIVAVLIILICFIGVWNRRKLRYITSAVFLVFGVVCIQNALRFVWVNLDIETYLKEQSNQSHFIEENFVDPRAVQLTFPENKQNLIYVFLESMEKTYASEDVGGAYAQNYISELTQMSENNVDFSTSNEIGGAFVTTGASWTMGAMFAQTTGMPLKIPIDGNGMEEQEVFFPDIATLGDILEGEGYYQELMIGSDAAFGGRENYFTQHGNYSIFDYNTAKEEGKIPPDYSVWWGYEDKKLFDFAKERLNELSLASQPFNLTLLTADTHFEDGYVCEECQNQFGNQYADVMACSSRHVMEFVNWVQQQPFGQNTTIVLAGDHLTMDKDFCTNIGTDYQRQVYEVFINPAQTAGIELEREFTTLDLFPTTLASLGVTIDGDRIGMGTNLFSADTATLVETYGFQYVNDELKKKSNFYDNFIKEIVVEENE